MASYYQNERVVNAFRVWLFMYGEDEVDSLELLNNEIICSGFTWENARNDGYIVREFGGKYHLTDKGIALAKGEHHGSHK